ncbi:hypothetical protein GALMADRAFT_133569 [Galerina marginata CBS 339.88]|uniref:Uncharacterized protein n=1 Tax=Galerina marginata (strain CBS 339.88) TaxID=685588 RepID=A0A067TW89_GALM3|nr:hypothetical protein GALMADRAFT_133569 [Galerina marginata CBS 339.88]
MFATPSVPLAGLILQQYFELGENSVNNQTLEFLRLQYAPTFVFEFTAQQFLDEETLLKRTEATADDHLKALRVQRDNELFVAAQTASSLPYYGLVDNVRQPGEKLFNHFDDFFAARKKRHEELMRVESPLDRQRRESRERHPPIENANMFVWEITQSSGGCQMYWLCGPTLRVACTRPQVGTVSLEPDLVAKDEE